jgi:branched-subunit amino acid aminotransferase/4-amino-4-deoxychorismate lyase
MEVCLIVIPSTRCPIDTTSGFELVTPPLDGMILPGVTRDSVLVLAREHANGVRRLAGLTDKLVISERPVTMVEVKNAAQSGRLVELFGSGDTRKYWITHRAVILNACNRHCGCDQPG